MMTSAVLRFERDRGQDEMAVDNEPQDGERRSGSERRESPDGPIVQTVKRVDATATIAQRWGAMVGTLLIVAAGAGLNWGQWTTVKDDVRELKEERRADDKRVTRLEFDVAALKEAREAKRQQDELRDLELKNMEVKEEARKMVSQILAARGIKE